MLSNEVLRTALTTLASLPPMSLAATQKLDQLANESLQQVLSSRVLSTSSLSYDEEYTNVYQCFEGVWILVSCDDATVWGWLLRKAARLATPPLFVMSQRLSKVKVKPSRLTICLIPTYLWLILTWLFRYVLKWMDLSLQSAAACKLSDNPVITLPKSFILDTVKMLRKALVSRCVSVASSLFLLQRKGRQIHRIWFCSYHI